VFEVELAYGLQLDSGNVLDRAGYRQSPDRHLHSASLSYRPSWLPDWRLTLEGRNLADERVALVPILPRPPGSTASAPQAVSDYMGFPLPGRAFYATLQWRSQP
jgi:outer membrane receptor protein involved in Fe transport